MKLAKRFKDYVKYSLAELESYVGTEGSCVFKVNTDMHFSLGPYCLADFKHALQAHIVRRKVGQFDNRLDGIILDIKNIKVLGRDMALRGDDSRLHVNITADCYVFRPIAGEVLSGKVKHVGNNYLGVIIYRVFNVSIKFGHKVDTEMEQEVRFRIKDFNLQNVFPYIGGELVDEQNMPKKITFKNENDSTQDSGIEEREATELDELLNMIKQEENPKYHTANGVVEKKAKKRKATGDSTAEESPAASPKKKKKTPAKTAATAEVEESEAEVSPLAVKVKSESQKEEAKKKRKVKKDATPVKIKQEKESDSD